jgi:L-ascorbate metabolism protein UlaG (beta-lactamase superfamily)
VGHATLLVELDGVRLLTDPLLRRFVFALRRVVPVRDNLGQGVDGVLISHLYRDHLDVPSLTRVGHALPVVVPRGGGSLLRRRRFRHVVEVDKGNEIELGGLAVRAVHAEHAGGRGLFRPAAALGYVISGSKRVYFAGDTDLFPAMAALAPLDVAPAAERLLPL